MLRKRTVNYLVALAIILAGYLLPGVGELSSEGVTTIFTLVSMIYMMSSGVPSGVMCITAVCSLQLTGLTASLTETISYFSSPFLVATLMAIVVGVALERTTIVNRVLLFFMNKLGGSTKGMCMAMWVTIIVISSVNANMTAAAILLPFAWRFLDLYTREEQKRQTARCLLVGLCIAVVLGGMITPLGNGCNMVVVQQLSDLGYTLNFAVWSAFGIPICIAAMALATPLLFKMYRPAELSDQEIAEFKASIHVGEPLSRSEKMLLAVYVLLIALCLLCSCWPSLFQKIDVMWILTVAGLLLVYPLGILDWKDVESSGAFTSTYFICAFMMMSGVLQKWGVVDVIIGGIEGLVGSSASYFILITLLGYLCIPMGDLLPSAVVPTVLATPLALLAEQNGLNPTLLVMPVALYAGASWMLPLDTVAIMTFQKGYYTVWDMFKPGFLLTLVFPPLTALMSLGVGSLMGMI